MEEVERHIPTMMPGNRELRQAALECLKGRWTYPVLCTLLYWALASISGTIPFAGLLFLCPFAFGFSITFLQFVRGEVEEDDIVTRPFAIFQHYGRYLCTSLLVTLFIFLWSLLLVVPGVVKAYSYALTPYIAHDHPTLSPRECLRQSQRMMNGYKVKLFLLDLSFIGWWVLCLLSCGIGFLWLSPYVETAHAKFYEELKARQNK